MIHLPLYPFVWRTASGTFRSSLTWEMTLSFALTLVIALGFVLLLILQWRDLRQRVTRPVRWGLCLLRAVAYVLVLGMLLNPALLIQKVAPFKFQLTVFRKPPARHEPSPQKLSTTFALF